MQKLLAAVARKAKPASGKATCAALSPEATAERNTGPNTRQNKDPGTPRTPLGNARSHTQIPSISPVAQAPVGTDTAEQRGPRRQPHQRPRRWPRRHAGGKHGDDEAGAAKDDAEAAYDYAYGHEQYSCYGDGALHTAHATP